MILNEETYKQHSSINPTVDHKDAKILLVDDQELNRDVLAHRLSKIGYKITGVLQMDTNYYHYSKTMFMI